MRITDGTIAHDLLFNVNKGRERINTLQGQLASGKRVQKVSDDPTASDAILRLNAAISRNEQYSKNIGDAQGFLDTTDSTLDGVGSMMQEVQQILVQAQDGGQTSSMLALGERVDKILNEAVALANTQFNGKYILGGTQTNTPPYQLVTNPGPPPTSTVTYTGNAATVQYATGESMQQQVSVTGAEAFNGTATFNLLIRVRDSLRAGTMPPAADVAAVGTALATVTQTNGKVGSLLQTLSNTATHLEDQKTQLQALLSVERDTDVASATMRLKQEELMLDAALNTGARILPKSLLNFLQ